jgi:hypothetical protein
MERVQIRSIHKELRNKLEMEEKREKKNNLNQ